MRTAILLVVFALAVACPASARQNEVRQNEVHYVTCDMVRAYVAQLGLVQARAVATAHGMTRAQERKARRCLE